MEDSKIQEDKEKIQEEVKKEEPIQQIDYSEKFEFLSNQIDNLNKTILELKTDVNKTNNIKKDIKL